MSAGEPFDCPVSEALVRTVVEEALGDGRLSGVGAGEPLLRSGVVTSIRLACVLVALERRFGVAIPQSAALQMSVASIVRALGGAATASERAPEDLALRRLKKAARRPAILVASLVASLLILDLGVQRLVEGPLAAEYRAFVEGGRRFYPCSGAFSQDGFRFARAHHEIAAEPPDEALRVAVFGDCGTMGLYVPAEEAIPARTEAALRAQGTAAKVYNLAWYGRLLAKDFMLLELVWDRPLDVIVFTLGDDYLRRSAAAAAIDVYPHVAYNRALRSIRAPDTAGRAGAVPGRGEAPPPGRLDPSGGPAPVGARGLPDRALSALPPVPRHGALVARSLRSSHARRHDGSGEAARCPVGFRLLAHLRSSRPPISTAARSGCSLR